MCKHNDDENIDHILLHCGFVRRIWAGLFESFGIVGVIPRKWHEFVELKWHFDKGRYKQKVLWRFAVLAAAWGVWMERNKRIFEGKSNSVEDLRDYIIFLIGLWARASRVLDSSESFLFSIDCASLLM